jgi:hypothetical protein
LPSIPTELLAPVRDQVRQTLSPDELADWNRRLRSLYEAGPGATVGDEDEASSSAPTTTADLIAQESTYAPDINDGVRVNIAPLQKAGLLAADVLAKKDVDKAIADRAQWRADERRWVREGKLPKPGWWPEDGA